MENDDVIFKSLHLSLPYRLPHSFLTIIFLIPVQIKARHQSCLCVDRHRLEWINRPLPNSINDQRAAKSKMTISKRFLLHVMFLLCDVTALVASAQVDNYVMFSSQNKDHRPADSSSVVEYHFDHEITERQARDNLRSMMESDFQTPAYCKPCSDEHKRYCHSENLLKDHCCCNQGHKKGEFVDTQFYRFSATFQWSASRDRIKSIPDRTFVSPISRCCSYNRNH